MWCNKSIWTKNWNLEIFDSHSKIGKNCRKMTENKISKNLNIKKKNFAMFFYSWNFTISNGANKTPKTTFPKQKYAIVSLLARIIRSNLD